MIKKVKLSKKLELCKKTIATLTNSEKSNLKGLSTDIHFCGAHVSRRDCNFKGPTYYGCRTK